MGFLVEYVGGSQGEVRWGSRVCVWGGSKGGVWCPEGRVCRDGRKESGSSKKELCGGN